MLKALELVGFKSFADRTRFEFPPGITAVVGPNGSGKSNVVDAIKWVLGEQSVKNLRGKEMADVIFNGSGSRRPMNAAEITLTLDNSRRLLAIDTPEVHITRRVYRSGESEYLVNRTPTRLRDIRDLLAGTGMGTQAYSVIEQGKVDLLLQSSPKERRMIFEEAAGISRFKARKIEALRRLERVEQNLLRLSDIVDEVESRLRSVKLQANKARRYKEYVDRLQSLRTQVALVDWTRLGEMLARFEAEAAELARLRDAAIAEAEALEARLQESEARAAELNEAIRRSEAETAADRERIAAAEAMIEIERARCSETEQEIARRQRQRISFQSRAGALEQQLLETREAVEAAEARQRQIARQVGERERALTDLMARMDQMRAEVQQRRAAQVEQMRAASALGSQIGALESQAEAARAEVERCRAERSDVEQQWDAVHAELDALKRRREELASAAGQAQARIDEVLANLERLRGDREQRQRELVELQKRHAAVAERAAVLEELERRHEGLSPGVKEVLAAAKNGEESPFRQVCGLVADLFRVSVESAVLVEVALGETAQHVVARPGRDLLDFLQAHPQQFSGRVGFVWLRPRPETEPWEAVNLDGWPGVLGRADRFVETEPEYEPLAKLLLGRTWFVEKLSHALTLAQTPQHTCHFVTLAGELLTADGTLCVGPRHAATGLISRRSELRALRGRMADLDSQVQQAESAVLRVQQQLAAAQGELRRAEADHRQAADSLARHEHKLAAAEERKARLGQQRTALEAEWRDVEVRHERIQAALRDAREQLRAVEAETAQRERELLHRAEELARCEAEWASRGREATEAKIELAKGEERLANLRARLRQFEESQGEGQRALAESDEQLALCRRRAEESQRNILRAEAEIAEWYLHKEASASRTADLVRQREENQLERGQLSGGAQRARAKVRKLEEKLHAKELAANQVRLERDALVERFREDYGVTLAELEHEPTQEEQRQREDVQKEIDELRQKINSLGNVNLEALEELNQLESRYTTLSTQHRDLSDAKNSLQRIIERINADSRRLFAETLESVRGHFVALFRDLFGGGTADIVLEEGADMLESGIEIVARPPGKEPRSISLLSGGEKTLTCVALLLAIFRSRPSPFCVLDEVDAALDEANIDRFSKVLRDFLAWTQFIIITHSKKTMTCATTIYGVTMQESGVSKQVSVRFEDISDNGEILLSTSGSDGPPPEAHPGEQTRAA